MQWNSDLTTTRIDCAAADLIDELYENALPEPCRREPAEVWSWLCGTYPVRELSLDDPTYARTAVAVLETNYPEDAEYLPMDAEECLDAVKQFYSIMQLHCAEIENTGSGAALYDEQRLRFEERAGRFGLVWKPMPITVSMEFNSGYRLVNGSQPLSDVLTVRCGVSEKDISERSAELLAFLRAKHALDNMDKPQP